MDYEKKYKDALARAKELCDVADTFTVTIHDIITIFPELKESKDDRIVRCLLNYFNHVRYNGLDLKGTDIDEVIAWLEKQVEQKPTEDVKTLDADKVIAWLVANICDFEHYVKLFKKDFGL